MSHRTPPHRSIQIRFAAVLAVALLNATLGLGQEVSQEDELWETPPISIAPQDAELTKLRKQKVNLAAKILRDGRYNSERTYGAPHETAQLRQAEMELAVTKEEKLAVLAREEARLLTTEKTLDLMVKGGIAPHTDLQSITAMRIGNQVAQQS